MVGCVPISVRPFGGGGNMRPFGTRTLSKKISAALSPTRRPSFDSGRRFSPGESPSTRNDCTPGTLSVLW